VIRPATERDIPSIAEIYRHHVLHGAATFELQPPDAAEMTACWSSLVQQGYPYLVADVDGRIAGYAYAGPYRPRSAYRHTVEDSIYLHPDFLGQGLGKLLLGAIIEECSARGYREMIAVIGDRANEASIRLHASFGFRMVGVLEEVGFKFDRWVDTVLMQLALEWTRFESSRQ